MCKHLVWILSSKSNAILKRNGLGNSFIVPAGIIIGDDKMLMRSNIWLVIRGKHDTLTAYIKAKKIEKFADGDNAGDYLLHVKMTSSFRISSSPRLNDSFNTSEFLDFQTGLHEISEEINNILSNFVLSNVQIKLVEPSSTIFSNIKLNRILKRDNRSVLSALLHVIQNFSLDEIWGSGSGFKFGPFQYFASIFLKVRGSSEIMSSGLNYLKTLDPLSSIGAKINFVPHSKNDHISSAQSVDIDFTEIDPEVIYAREFIASDIDIDKLETSLTKTEIGEKLHQDMLRDISSYLKSEGFVPYETNSIDLMIESHSNIKIFELKSTNENNLFAQLSKGAFQLAYYSEALREESIEIQNALIIYKTNSDDLEKLCANALRRLNIKCLIYNPILNWPNKVEELLDFIKN